MVQIYYGRAGAGKTSRLLSLVQKDIDAGRRVFILVPEQFAVVTEQRLNAHCGNGASLLAEVITFRRMPQRVFLEEGGGALTQLSRGGKLLLTAKAIREAAPLLQAYGRVAHSPSFTEKICALLDLFGGQCVDAQRLGEVAAELPEGGSLKARCEDLAAIAAAREGLIRGGLCDPNLLAERLNAILAEKDFFRGCAVYVDAFEEFTQQQYRLLAHICRQSESCRFFMTCDDPFGRTEIFAHARNTVARLRRLCAKEGVEIALCPPIEDKQRFKTPGTAFAEAWLRTRRGQAEDATGLTVFRGEDAYEEAEYIARRILQLTSQGLRYRDIHVVCRDASLQQGLLDHVLRRFGIPCFMDDTSDPEQRPLFLLVGAALDVCARGFRREDVFRYLKSGLTPAADEDIFELEQYCLTWGISGSRFCDGFPWTFHPDGLIRTFDEEAHTRLAHLNQVRGQICTPLLTLQRALTSATVRQAAEALFAFLQELGVAERCVERADFLERAGELRAAEESRRLWNTLLDGLDDLVLICGDEAVNAEAFKDLMTAVFTSADLGVIPTTVDEVVIADAKRMRAGGCRAVFVAGLNDGLFPAAPGDDGLLSLSELELLEQQHGLDLQADSRLASSREQYFLYAACTLASERLYLTYPAGDESGAQLLPSMELTALAQSAGVPILSAHDLSFEDKLWGKEACVDLLMGPDAYEKRLALRRFYQQDPRFETTLACLDGNAAPLAPLQRETVEALYGRRLHISPSSLQAYSQCPYKFFTQYGLRLKERESGDLNGSNIGTFIHYVLEYFVSRTIGKGGPGALTEEACTALTEEAVQAFADTYFTQEDALSARFRHLFGRLKRNALLLTQRLVREFAQSDFLPAACELPLTGEAAVQVDFEGGRLQLTGKVDRVDTFRKDGVTYLRVVDYKTGERAFRCDDLLNGLGMQLLIYLFSLCQGKAQDGTPLFPAGALYLPATPKAQQADEDGIRFVQNGLLLGEAEILRSMDRQLDGTFIFAKFNKNGEPYKNIQDRLATPEQLGVLWRHMKGVLKKMGEEVCTRGQIRALPLRDKHEDACRFCPMRALCRHGEDGPTRCPTRLDRGESFWEQLEKGDDRP